MDSQSFPPDSSPYWIDSPIEVQHLFRSLALKSSKVTLWMSPTEFAPSMVLALLPNGDVVLDVDVDDRVNQNLLSAPMVIVSGNVNKVPLKCQLSGLRLGLYQGAQAFIAPAPRRIHKLQRREFFRVTIPATKPLYCRFDIDVPPPFGKGAPVTHSTRNRVLDLSLGGLLLEMQDLENYMPKPRAQVGPCRVDLPEEGTITFDLLFCHVQTSEDRRGHVIRKVGAQFRGLSQADQKRLYPYVLQLEREQRMSNS